MKKNYLTAKKQNLEASHGGSGPYALYEIWAKSDFSSNVDFIDRMTIPPGSSVAYHRHSNNEEMYIVLSGTAVMTVDGEQTVVSEGDMVLTKPQGSHGLVNNSEDALEILVLQIGV